MRSRTNSAFTLIELLVVIAVIAVLSVTVILSLNPAELLRQSRDTNRLSDMDTLNHALSVYSVDQSGMPSFFMGSSSVVYVSLPDSSSTCGNLNLPILPTGYTYACAASTTLKNTNGSGWIPVPLSSTSGGSPVGNLPIDPTNQSSTRLYYTYTTNGTQYELTTNLESFKYKLGGPSDQISGDGGTLATVYEKGSKLGLEPLDYGDTALVGLWTFDEGSGTVARDYSGNNGVASLCSSGSCPGASPPAWALGKMGGALGFDGTTTYVSIPSNAIIDSMGKPGVSYSVSLCFKTSVSANQSLTEKWIGGPYPWAFRGPGPGISFVIYDGVSGVGPSTSGNLADNNWHCAVGMRDYVNRKVSLYVDGALQGSTPENLGDVSNSGAFPIGSRFNSASGRNFSGIIDDVRIYSRALSAAEIAAMYNGGK